MLYCNGLARLQDHLGIPPAVVLVDGQAGIVLVESGCALNKDGVDTIGNDVGELAGADLSNAEGENKTSQAQGDKYLHSCSNSLFCQPGKNALPHSMPAIRYRGQPCSQPVGETVDLLCSTLYPAIYGQHFLYGFRMGEPFPCGFCC